MGIFRWLCLSLTWTCWCLQRVPILAFCAHTHNRLSYIHLKTIGICLTHTCMSHINNTWRSFGCVLFHRYRCTCYLTITCFIFARTHRVLILAFVTLCALVFQPISAGTCLTRIVVKFASNPYGGCDYTTWTNSHHCWLYLWSSSRATRLQHGLEFRVYIGNDPHCYNFLPATCGKIFSYLEHMQYAVTKFLSIVVSSENLIIPSAKFHWMRQTKYSINKAKISCKKQFT